MTPHASPVCRSRRHLLAGASALTTLAMLRAFPDAVGAEPPPEISRIRLVHGPFLCFAPNYIAESFLRMEGFNEIEYARIEASTADTLSRVADLAILGATGVLPSIDRGLPITVLAGLHMGCWELFATEQVQAIRDLRGKRIAIMMKTGVDHAFVANILAYVGIDPNTEVQWVVSGRISESMRLFEEGKVDAFLAFPPQPQDLRLKRLGHVLVNTTTDRPWSHYFCCMLIARRAFVQRNPVATKRALRAILKAADFCDSEPRRAAQMLVERGFESRPEVATEVIEGLSYGAWRQVDPADTLRFHGNRLHDIGLIKSTPQQILEHGTDFRFLNEIRRELKT